MRLLQNYFPNQGKETYLKFKREKSKITAKLNRKKAVFRNPQPDTIKEVVTIVLVTIVSVTFVVVAIGLSFYCYRVKSSHCCSHL